MSSSILSTADFGSDSTRADNVVLTARPDMRVVYLGFLGSLFIAAIGAVVYLLPISDSAKVAFLPLAAIFVVVLVCSAIFFEALGNTTFVVTNEYLEEKGGFLWKTQHSLPLDYVRDVTYSQTLVQDLFGVSSVTVSPTNGNKIVLANVKDGAQARDIIWRLVLARSR